MFFDQCTQATSTAPISPQPTQTTPCIVGGMQHVPLHPLGKRVDVGIWSQLSHDTDLVTQSMPITAEICRYSLGPPATQRMDNNHNVHNKVLPNLTLFKCLKIGQIPRHGLF